MLVQVKQVRRILQSFYFKNNGRGSLYNGLTTLPERSNTGYVDTGEW